jgi:succinoglycan biosynthesis protein ExoA
MAAEAWPSIDVLVSTYNEGAYIGRCLDHVLGQDYPGELVRVWLIDGGSTDETVPIVRARAETEPRLRVIADGRRLNLPEALNIGIEASGSELVAKIDAHGYPEHDFLRRAVDAFNSEGPAVACVGGRPQQLGETRFGRALALARTSRFGVGASEYAGSGQRTFVDTVQCGVYRRDPLLRVGLFDADMQYGEDEELNWRLREAGFRILLDTGIRFNYIARPSWKAAYRQYRNYGEARTRVVAKHPSFLRPHHLVPAAFVAGATGLAAASPLSAAARRALGACAMSYVSISVAAAAQTCRRNGLPLLPWVGASYSALHFGYGVGMLQGLPTLVRAAKERR